MTMTPDRRTFINVVTGVLASPSVRSVAKPVAVTAGRPSVNVADLGAIGDGAYHPLSERFVTLAEAQATFPSARSLSDSLDGAAIQTAIDIAAARGERIQAGGHVLVPAGRYPLSRSLRLPNAVILEGMGAGVTIIDNQNHRLSDPLIVNDNPSTAKMKLKNLSLHGGSHGVRISVTGSVDGVFLDGISFQLQSDKNLECNKLLQIAAFYNCIFGSAPYGVYAAAWTSNVLLFEHCSFENHTMPHLYLRGAECINIVGGRFEGGGQPDGNQATIDIEGAASVNIKGVYFENTHPVLLKERKSRNTVVFDGCHFSGALGKKGLTAYQFDSDGIVGFGSNDWGLPTSAPAKTLLFGTNNNLWTDGRVYFTRSGSSHHIRSESIDVTAGVKRDILTLRYQGAGNRLTLCGTLTIKVVRLATNGVLQSQTYRRDVAAVIANGLVHWQLGAAAGDIPLMQIRSSTGFTAVVLDIPPGSEGQLSWEFAGELMRADPDTHAVVDLD